MAQTGFTPIVTYNTATATTIPSAANLAQGELAVNVTDKKLYTKDSGGNVVLLASSGGDVTGPASSTNLAIPTFSGTGGKTLLNNSGVTITAGVITATGFSGPLTGNVTGNVSGSSGSCTGNASTVTTNANLTGPITSVGNATSIASQTGTGTTFAMSASPTFTGTVGAADLTTTGNTILGNASTDTLNVGNGNLVTDASGNLGVGTTSPTIGGANKTIVVQAVSGLDSGVVASEPSTGNFLQIYQPAASDSYLIAGKTGGTPTQRLLIYTGGAERMRIASNGIVTMSAYGAGAATFSAAGVISSVSDETWKTKDGVPLNPDAMLQKLEPGYWFYNQEKALIFGAERQLGFYAQNVNYAIGVEAAPIPETYTELDENGIEITKTKPWGYYDRSVLAVTVMSLQKALATIESLTARIQALEAK
jgi:hypothetical protein